MTWCCMWRPVLDALDRRLSAVLADGNPSDRVVRLAQAYLSFTHEKPRLWNLLFEHHMPAKAQLPPWYQQKLEGLMGKVEEAMAPLFPPGRRRSASVPHACCGPACTASPRSRPPTSCPW